MRLAAWSATLALLALVGTARADRAFSARFSTNEMGDITMAANTLMRASTNTSQAANASQAAAVQNGTASPASANQNNNNFMTFVDVDGDGSTFNSSTADLVLPSGATILFAGLYWGADTSAGSAVGSPFVAAGSTAPSAASRNEVRFATPLSGYSTITASVLDTGASQPSRYQGFADVTATVQAAGAGTYTVANVQSGTGADRYAVWALVVAYRVSGDAPKNLTVFDGFRSVSGTTPVTITISGFTTPANGAVNARVGVVAYEGDMSLTGDQMNFNGVSMTDALNPSANTFNSTIGRLGTRVATKNPDYVNQLGVDADILLLNNPSNTVLANNASSASVGFTSSGDVYFPGVVTTSIDLYAPIITAPKTFVDLNGGAVTPGDVLEYTIVVNNTGGDDAAQSVLRDDLPPQVTYVPGSAEIIAGANTGAKTDAAGDDQVDYIAGTRQLVFRLGTGADATSGGLIPIGGSTTVKFQVTVNAGVSDGTTITNTGEFSYSSLATGVALVSNTSAASVQNSKKLSGTVFEDVNYGGGAGRNLATSGGVPRPGARVELYDSAGTFVSATTTDASGVYTFLDVSAGNYTLRVVSGTVSSSRPGAGAGQIGVPTFANGDVHRVGGEDPTKVDAGNGSTTLAALTTATTTAQAIAALTVPIGDLLDADFGFNFDTVTNTRDSGQGSLRQFIINANALGNAGLAQSGLTAGRETSIFMISDGAAHPGLRAGLPGQLTGGVAVISPATALPALTDAGTTIDGTTQTANTGDTNAGTLGAGGTVGVDGLALSAVNRPEIELSFAAAIAAGIDIAGGNSTVRGIALHGAQNGIRVGTAAGTLIEQNIIGTTATAFSDPGAAARSATGILGNGGDGAIIRNNLVGFTDQDAIHLGNGSDGWAITNNEVRSGGLNTAGNPDNIRLDGGTGTEISGNLITQGYDANIDGPGAGLTAMIENNTVTDARGLDGIRDSGSGTVISKNIVTGTPRTAVQAGSNSTVSGNRITANLTGIQAEASQATITGNEVFANTGAGIRVNGGNRNRISQNSTYANAGPGIDLLPAGVTANDGAAAGGSNNGFDYPIITSATLSGSTLTLRGYIGSAPGQAAFGGATIEVFKADNTPADQNGAVVAGDGRSVPHGEGRTYLGAITAAADGTFNTTLSVSGLALGESVTATAAEAVGNTSEFGPNALVTSFLAGGVSGFVYLDTNHNLQRDAGEEGTGLGLFAKIFPVTTSGPAQQAVAVNPTTGAYAFSDITPGEYTIVLDNNATLADVTPTLPPGWSGTEHPSRIRTPVAVTSAPVNELNFGLTNSMPVSGRVFSDTGAGGGIPNDGIRNGAEPGLAGVAVRLTDATGTIVYDSTTTGGNGDYVLFQPQTIAPGATIRVVETNAPATVSTGATVGTTGGGYDRATDAVSFAFVPDAARSGVDFGDVPANVFTNDGAQTGLPGSTVVYPHTYTAGSAGTVSFSAASSAAPAISGWSFLLYRDTNANGQLDPGEPELSAPVALATGETIAVLVKEFIPVNAAFNNTDTITVTATFTYVNASPALVETATRTNVTTVGDPTTAGLTLVKSVDKATARPGETLTYTIQYTNNSSDVLRNVVIHDTTPAFTTFAAASNGPLPNDLTAATVTAPVPAAAGPIRWTFTGTLRPGGTGTVAFQVVVDQ